VRLLGKQVGSIVLSRLGVGIRTERNIIVYRHILYILGFRLLIRPLHTVSLSILIHSIWSIIPKYQFPLRHIRRDMWYICGLRLLIGPSIFKFPVRFALMNSRDTVRRATSTTIHLIRLLRSKNNLSSWFLDGERSHVPQGDCLYPSLSPSPRTVLLPPLRLAPA
jgi:hypothetical protein